MKNTVISQYSGIKIRYAACLSILFANGLFAAATPPCSSGANHETILPVKNTIQAYCISDYGWSDSWFFSNPASYDGHKDVLSGDDALFVRYTVGAGNTPGHGNGFLSPSMDRGTLNPIDIGSNWSVVQSLAYTHAYDATKSVIQDATDHLVLSIMTQVIGPQVSLRFTFTNNGAQSINNLRFGDYWNYHPNGSKNGTTESLQGTTSYSTSTGDVTTTGNKALASFISDGTVFGQRKPDVHQIGTISNVLNAVNTNTFAGANGPLGPGDYAAAIAWDLGSLAPGKSTSFAITKEFGTPEPSTMVLLGLGCALMAVRFRRKTPLS
jgi:hypothetical protein